MFKDPYEDRIYVNKPAVVGTSGGYSVTYNDTYATDEISVIKKNILDSAHSDFLTTILNGKLGSELISKRLGDSSVDVRSVALSYACASLSSDEVSESDEEKIFASFSKYYCIIFASFWDRFGIIFA